MKQYWNVLLLLLETLLLDELSNSVRSQLCLSPKNDSLSIFSFNNASTFSCTETKKKKNVNKPHLINKSIEIFNVSILSYKWHFQHKELQILSQSDERGHEVLIYK